MTGGTGARSAAVLAAAALGAFVPLALAFWHSRYLAFPVYWVSLDDVYRAHNVWQVGRGQWVPNDVWPPMPSWLGFVAFVLGTPLPWALGAVNLVASAVTAGLAVLLVTRLGATPVQGFVAAALFVLQPWAVRLGGSGLAEPLAVCLVVTTIPALSSRRPLLAGVFYAAAVLTRLDALLALPVVAIVGGARAALPAVLAAAAYGAFGLHIQGDPLAALHAATVVPVAKVWRDVVVEAWSGAGGLLVAGAAAWTTRGFARRHWVFLVPLLGQAALVALGIQGAHNGGRSWWLAAAWLLPVLAEGVRSALVPTLILALPLLVTTRAVCLPRPDDVSADTIATGAWLRDRPGNIWIEGSEPAAEAIQLLAGPERVRFDRAVATSLEMDHDGARWTTLPEGWVVLGTGASRLRWLSGQGPASHQPAARFGDWCIVDNRPERAVSAPP